jgi:hypothetical protein
MNRCISVQPWLADKEKYDLLLGTVGYEQRARFAFSKLDITAPQRLAFGFKEQQELSYEENKTWYTNAGFEISEPSSDEFRKQLLSSINHLGTKRNYICVDISSMTRLRMALVVDAFRKAPGELVVDFVYSIAAYSPPLESFSPNTHVGAVLPSFAGWWINPQRPPVAIVGLGYEEDKALGAVEHIQVSEIWLFIPKSEIPEYSHALTTANATLLELVPQDHHISYRVEDPVGCFEMLEVFTSGIVRRANPVLLPFGPKIFALCCLLTATAHSTAAVWRVSPQDLEKPTERRPTGTILGIRVQFASDEIFEVLRRRNI